MITPLKSGQSVGAATLHQVWQHGAIQRQPPRFTIGDKTATTRVCRGTTRHDAEIRNDRCPLDHAAEARRRQWCTALRNEDEWRLGAFPLVLAQLAQLAAGQRVRAWGAVLDPPDVQGRGFEVDLLPAQIDHFGRP